MGELLWKKLRVTNSFAIHYTHQIQWNGVSLNIIGSHNFYNVGVRLATYANKVPSDGIVGEFYSIPSGFTDIKVVEDKHGLGNEAVRVLKSMPKWKPAQHNGRTVRSQFTLPIKVRVNN